LFNRQNAKSAKLAAGLTLAPSRLVSEKKSCAELVLRSLVGFAVSKPVLRNFSFRTCWPEKDATSDVAAAAFGAFGALAVQKKIVDAERI
jgi:hypothetical protein